MAAEVSPSSTGLLLGVGGVPFCSLPQGPVTGITMGSSPSHGSHSSHDKSWDHPASAAQSPLSTDHTDAFARSPAAETADERVSDTTPTRGTAEAAAEGESQPVCEVLRWGQKKRLRYVRSQNPTTSSPPSHPSVPAGDPVSSIAGITAVRAVCKDEKKGAWEEEWRESGERAGEDACRSRVASGRGAKKGGEACEMEGAEGSEGNKAAASRMKGESVKEEAGRGSTALGTRFMEFAHPCKVKRASARAHEPSLPALCSRGEKEARGRGVREQCDQQLPRLDDVHDGSCAPHPDADAHSDNDADNDADDDADDDEDVSGGGEADGYDVDAGEGAFSDDSCPARSHTRRKRYHGQLPHSTREHKGRGRERGKERKRAQLGEKARKVGSKKSNTLIAGEDSWEDHSSCGLIQSYRDLFSTPHPSVASLIFSGHCPLSAASAAAAAAAAAAATLPTAAETAIAVPKFLISLSRVEKEEDFWAIRGGRLPLRPKKRAKAAEKGVQRLQPGAWLTGVCCERYQVRERKSKKKTRGLRGMSGRGSDTE